MRRSASTIFVSVVESGAIVGTEFGRVVPNFVAQQRPIRDAITLRDEVSRRGLTRGNLSWASAGLDTGPAGLHAGHHAAAAQRRRLHGARPRDSRDGRASIASSLATAITAARMAK